MPEQSELNRNFFPISAGSWKIVVMSSSPPSAMTLGSTVRARIRTWRRLLADLDRIDEIVLADAGHLPGRTVNDLLAILATLTEHGVSLSVPSQGIDTTTGSAAILDLIGAYRRAKRSQAIRQGQAKSSKRNGRPPIPAGVQRQIAAALADGGGIRPTAKKFGVSPGSIMNIRRSMAPIIVEAA